MKIKRLRFTFAALAFCTGASCRAVPGLPPNPPSGGLNGITVTGECLRKVTQDRGSVSVSSSKVLPTSRQASESVMASHEQLKVKVKALGLKDYTPETAGFSVREERAYENKKWVSKGYRATVSSTFETSDISRLGEVLVVASEVGAENIGGLNIFVSPEKLKSEREACLEAAMENAAAKATRIATGAGVKIDRVIEVNENDGSSHFTSKAYFAAGLERGGEPVMGVDSGAGPAVEMKPMDLAVKLTARFGITN